LNQDHRRTHEAVLCACRPKPDHPVRELYFFEIASSTEWATPATFAPFTPHLFFSLSKDSAELKEQSLIEAYGREMRPGSHPRSAQGIAFLNFYRGASVGVETAEAFMVGRIIR